MTNVNRARLSKTLNVFQGFKLERDFDNKIAEEFFISLDTPLSLAMYIMFKNGEHLQMAKYDYDPRRETDVDVLRRNLAAYSFLRKYDGLNTGIDTKQVAVDSFQMGESRCKETNDRFRVPLLDPLYKGVNVWLHHAFTRKIAKVLGKYRKEDFFSLGSWGPGSSLGITGNDTSAVRKFRYERQITTRLYSLIKDELSIEYPNWFPSQDVVEALVRNDASQLLTVKKNALTDRTIFQENGINTWFQKSLGQSIRSCLLRHGYDLNSTALSHRLAREGSITGTIVTVDKKNASNTIAKLMVRESIKDNVWFTLLDCCRTPSYRAAKGGEVKQFEMFSSMGNGFTFELESLLFVCAAEACHDYLGLSYEEISVHGDDITISSSAYKLYREFCNFLGFEINEGKSFSDGYFRESCGSYYFNGFDVKPYFHKEKSHDAKSIYKLANGINSLSHRFLDRKGRDSRFLSIHRTLVNRLPDALKLKGTVELGDVCLHYDFDEATPALAKHGWEGYLVPCLVSKPVELVSTSPAVLLARLWYPSKDMSYGNRINLRKVTRTLHKKVFVQRWYDHGPWTSVSSNPKRET